MRHLTSSEKQWIASFAGVDAAFWLLMLGICVVGPDGCMVEVGFSTVGFYAPFWFFTKWIHLGSMNPTMELMILSAIGFLCHAFIGWFIGFATRRHPVRWYVSVPVSVACVVLISVVGHKIGEMMGVLG